MPNNFASKLLVNFLLEASSSSGLQVRFRPLVDAHLAVIEGTVLLIIIPKHDLSATAPSHIPLIVPLTAFQNHVQLDRDRCQKLESLM